MKIIIIIGFMLVAWWPVSSQEVSTTRYPSQIGILSLINPNQKNDKLTVNEGFTIPNHITPDFHGSIPISVNKSTYLFKNPGIYSRIASPAPCINYQGLNDQELSNTSSPPDVGGAVGIDYVMVTQNTGVKIQGKNSGNPLRLYSLSNFFSQISAVDPFDPKVLYDPFENKWIVTCADQTTSLQSRLLLAVSQTSNPTGGWFYFAIDVDPAKSTWFDYPSIGFNKKWIVISGNMYNNSNVQQNVAVFSIDKMLAYSGTMNVTRFQISGQGSTIHPCITYDNNLSTEWLCNNYNSNNNGRGYLQLYTITGTSSTPSFTITNFTPSVGSTWSSANQTINTFNCSNIDVGDSRIRSFVYQGGSLWAVQKIKPNSTPTRSSIQWWEISPINGLTTQCGLIDDIGGNNIYFNPSLAVNVNKDVLIGYSHYSPALLYPNAAYSFRNSTYTLESVLPTYDYKSSNRMDCRADPNPPHNVRWGDFSSTIVDPNGLNLWTLQEYIPNGTGAGSWWAELCLAPSCIPVHNIIAPISTPNIKYEASDHITASSLISQPNGFVKFDGAKYVEYIPGFTTQITSGFFETYIDGCGGLKMSENYFASSKNKLQPTDSVLSANKIQATKFNVFPNPANNLLYFNLPVSEDRIVKINIFDAMNKTVISRFTAPTESSINISKIPKGIYFIVITTKLTEYKTVFVKQ